MFIAFAQRRIHSSALFDDLSFNLILSKNIYIAQKSHDTA